MDAELEDVPYDNDNFTMHRPTLERQVTLRKSSTGHKAVASGMFPFFDMNFVE